MNSEIPCPSCQTPVPIIVPQLLSGKAFVCPNCKLQIAIHKESLAVAKEAYSKFSDVVASAETEKSAMKDVSPDKTWSSSRPSAKQAATVTPISEAPKAKPEQPAKKSKPAKPADAAPAAAKAKPKTVEASKPPAKTAKKAVSPEAAKPKAKAKPRTEAKAKPRTEAKTKSKVEPNKTAPEPRPTAPETVAKRSRRDPIIPKRDRSPVARKRR